MAKLVKTEEETMLADMARGFLDEAAPVGHLRALRDGGKTQDPALWAEMAKMGWAGVLVPEEQGGSDMGHAAAGVLAEEMGRTLVTSPFLSTAVIAATALRSVADDRTGAALRAIAAGECIYALAVDEGHKHDPDAVELAATKVGNGFRLTGKKQFVVDGANADRLLDQDPENATLAVSLAKARANQTAKLAVIEGVQMHGGIGMTDAFDMGFYMKRARVAAEWLGDYSYHANKVAQARGF